MAFKNRSVEVNGISLNVIVEGSGPTVLLVHGFPDDHSVWRKQIPALVDAGYRVVVPDTRGCGDSDAPLERSAYHIDLLVSDLVSLLDALEIGQVKLVAHDWGAVIAWRLCIQHPERVERYAALSVGHPTAYSSASIEQKLRGWYILSMQLRGVGRWIFTAGNWWFFRKFARYDAEFPHWKKRLSRPGRLAAGMNYYNANIGMIIPTNYPPVAMPVMGVWSTGDFFLTEAQMLDTARFATGPWRYERIEGANHWLQLDAADRVNELLLDFLS